MPQYGFEPVLQQYDVGRTLGIGQQAKQNALADLSRKYAGPAMAGDQNALARLGSVDPNMALNVRQENRLTANDERQSQLQKLQDVASIYTAADTPEKFAQAVNMLKSQGYNLDPQEADFGNRELVIAKATSLKDHIAQGRDAQQFAFDERKFAADQAYRNESLGIQREALNQKGQSGVTDDVNARKTAAADMGLTPDSPAYQSYVLTGKMPREDAQPLTSTDKKAILEADDMAFAAENAIGQLKHALTLNDKASYGATAGTESFVARNDPWGILNATGVVNAERGAATTEFSNTVLNQALGSMKSIFGGNPTEGERAVLVDLQASVDKTPAERGPILDRAIKLAERRLQFNRDRAAEIRGQEFYKPGGGLPGGGATQPIKSNGDMTPENAALLIEQANDAIKRGADRTKVMERLAEQGIEVK